MHWGGGLFLLLCLFCLLPLRLEFVAEHEKQWWGRIQIQFLWLRVEKQFPAAGEAVQTTHGRQLEAERTLLYRHKSENKEQRTEDTTGWKPEHRQRFFAGRGQKMTWRQRWQDRWQRTSFQAQWKAILLFAVQAIKLVARWLRLEQCTVRCRIGWAQPDWTAYSYGLFWTAVSCLPKRWLAQSSFTYVPDFQQQRQEVGLRGIIGCRVGHLILILLSLLWLVGKVAWAQRRKEQILYEG